MGKKETKGAADKSAALTQEEFQKLTPEEQLAYFNKLNAANEELASSLVAAKKNAAKASATDALPIVTGVEEDNDTEAGDYQWTAPTFTWDDNTVLKVADLMKDFEGKDKKAAEKAGVIIASLLQRKSGLLTLIKKEEE
jgi:hypothetical protein